MQFIHLMVNNVYRIYGESVQIFPKMETEVQATLG